MPHLSPYTPSLYQPDSFGRYRKYPHVVDTPIPGAGYRVGELVWGEQELNLDGGRPAQPYGSYSTVPLRGLGSTVQISPQLLKSVVGKRLLLTAQQSAASAPPPAPPADTGSQGGQAPTERTPEDYGFDVAAEIAAAAEAAEAMAAQASTESEGGNFLTRRVGPVPYWAIGLMGIAVVGGGGYLLLRRKKVSPNRRRRR